MRYRRIPPAVRAWLRSNASAWTAREIADACSVSGQAVRDLARREVFKTLPGNRAAHARSDDHAARHRARVGQLAAVLRGVVAASPEIPENTRRKRKDRTRSRRRAPQMLAKAGSVLGEEPDIGRTVLNQVSARWGGAQ